MTFDDLGLAEPLLRALQAAGYTTPTPVQARGIPALLAGHDLCGTAQTGTGKTAAFALPILQRLASSPSTGRIRALILAPTRELAAQIAEAFGAYGRNLPGVRSSVVFGGMKDRAQRRALTPVPDVLVATTGRLLDLCGQGIVNLDAVEWFVLDEADRMLEMGFITDVRAVAKRLPAQRQTAMFSATLPKDVEKLAAQILRAPVRVTVTPPSAVADHIAQYVQFVERPRKRLVLLEILADPGVTSAIVFTRTRHGADRVAAALAAANIAVAALHADKVPAERTAAMAGFARGETRVLVATDIAARGIDVDGVSHIVNYDIPNVAETYIHRIGRTARAGAAGVAISLCAPDERPFLVQIERLTGQRLVEVGSRLAPTE